MAVRGKAHPKYALTDAIDMIKKIYEECRGAPTQIELIAEALGHKTNNWLCNNKTSTLQQFGLLVYDATEKKYQVTARAITILHPLDDNELKRELYNAFLEPPLYKAIMEDYAGDFIPKALKNLMHRSYGINSDSATIASDLFRESAIYAGCLEDDDNLTYRIDIAENKLVQQSNKEGDPTATKGNLKSSDSPTTNVSSNEQRITLQFQQGQAIITTPAHLTAGDIVKLKKAIELLELSVQDSLET